MNIQLSHQGGNPPRIVMRCPAGQRREADELAGLLGFARTTVWNDASPDHAWAVVSAIPSTKATAASVMEAVDYFGKPLTIVVGKVLGFRKDADAPAEYTDVFFAGEDDPWKVRLVEHAFRASLLAALEGKTVPAPLPASTSPHYPHATSESARRVYYQDIVYAVCAALDAIDGRTPGNGIQCGTVNEPSRAVHERMEELVRYTEAVRTMLPALLADYDHAWPNEDAGTNAHRRRMLGFIYRLIGKKEGENLQQGEPPVVPRGTVPAWPSNLPFNHGQKVTYKDAEGKPRGSTRIYDFKTTPAGREYLLEGVLGFVPEDRLEAE